MKMKKVALQVALLTGFGLAAGAANASLSTGEMIIVHPFQWTYDNIAKECTEVLGPSGYDGVQISQPAEHIARTDVWWAVYQPVNFNNFTTMTGNEQQLRNMIKTCHAAGVKVFADAVFNQRGSDGSTGLGGSNFNGNQNNPSYPDLNADDFHRNNCSIDYGNAWTIRNCALSGMPDIATDNPSTQDKIAGYLKNLMSMGVDGFRIDAAKHMQPSDIQAILGKAGNPPAYLEVIGADGEPVQPTDYTGIPNSVVTEFRYCGAMMGNWQNDAAKVKYLLGMNDSWFQLKSNQAEVFVNNHDNERGSAGTSYMTYKWGALYNLAQSFMVAYPWGQLRQVYSGYEFSAHDPGGPLWADRCTGGWLCQHRVPFVQNAVSFARATRGEGVTNTGSEGKVIWFSRGNKGFYVLNATNSDVTKSFKTNMPDGTYKEILGQSDRSAGADITVSGGMATITVKGMSAAAICTDSTWCGGKPKQCESPLVLRNGQCVDPDDPIPVVQDFQQLYVAGTMNDWGFTALTYDKDSDSWSGKFTLSGQGDANGAQRFKVTEQNGWAGNVWGLGSGSSLCSNQASCGDVALSETGECTITVTDSTSPSWSVSCGGPTPNKKDFAQLYYAGTTNSWTFTKMDYDSDKDEWTTKINFTGEGDANGAQRFKITTQGDWKGQVFGQGSGSTLCDNQATCGDVPVSESGTYILHVSDNKAAPAYSLTKYDPVTCKSTEELINGKCYAKCASDETRNPETLICEPNIQPTHDAMYYAGTTNGWTFDAMKFNSKTGNWEIGLQLTGLGDADGAQRFKVTSDADWEHTVWGKGKDKKLCSYQISCGDVLYSEVGDYTLQVNDSDLTYKLVKNGGDEPVVECKAPKVLKNGKCVEPEITCGEGEVLVGTTCEPHAVCTDDQTYIASTNTCVDGGDLQPADPAECSGTSGKQCTKTTKTVCSGAAEGSIEQGSYATNPNGQVGKNKTISSYDDWTEDMMVARGAANDDPRAFRGYHEKATDIYAVYAAWDDSNLYLMAELPDLQNQDPLGDFNYANDQFLPMGIAINTGKRTPGDGHTVDGFNLWTQGDFYSIKEGVDTILMFHPRNGIGEPGVFKTNADGKFSYDAKNGYLIGFDKAGVTRGHVDKKTLASTYMGSPDNYGLSKDAYLSGISAHQNLKTGVATGHLYQVTIPLATLDIDKSWLETNGIKVMWFSTFGESVMDAVPWDPSLIDAASEAYSKDDSTSHEKEDTDEYSVPLASVGHLTGGSGDCHEVEVEQCTEGDDSLPAACTAPIDVTISEEEGNSSDSTYVADVTVYTGLSGLTYSWTGGSESVKTDATETKHAFSFKKGCVASVKTVKVDAVSASGNRKGSASVKVNVPAREDQDGCTGGSTDWTEDTGDTVEIPPFKKCEAPEGSIVLKADVSTAPTIYAYTKDTETALTAKWPGDAMTELTGCAEKFWYFTPSTTKNVLAIFSSVNGERYPADMQPGAAFSADKSCFDWSSKTFKAAADCGMTSSKATISLTVNGGSVNGVSISQKDDVEDSGYVDAAFVVRGDGIDGSAQGTYSVDGSEPIAFNNGAIIRIGRKIEATDTEAGEAPKTAELTITFDGVSKTFSLSKKKWTAPKAESHFTWDNALVYFVMTDRFQNGDTSNDHNFNRPYKDTHGHSTATFHGGDIKGMTERLDYIKSLGMNAIWITAPYEQAHGWTGGGSSGNFAHWAYHGYYGLDWTALDPNMGTVDEFRTFVTEAHKRGIRVVLDIVMNHTGYATLQDMCDFNFGLTKDGWDPCKDWTGESFHQKPIDESPNSKWDNWWGKDWLRFGAYGGCGSSDTELCTSFLPDFKNNDTHGAHVGIPQFLQKKWASGNAKYDVPAAKKYRSGSMSVAEFEAHWLSSLVEEFGIDGFRCDTAKHVAKSTWKLLKEYSNEALQTWRKNHAGEPGADWTDSFWMTGEHWMFGTDPTDGAGYNSQGGFDSMINFSLGCQVPSVNTWNTYANMFGKPHKLNALSYVSSHDTKLCRPGDQSELGIMLELLPGGVQVYYGDETARVNDNGGSGNDAEHGTRSDMNFPSDVSKQSDWAENVDTLSTDFSSNDMVATWQKVGQFRFRNAAVGAGEQSTTSDGSICRKYTDGDYSNAVVIHLGSASSVNVSGCFEDGTELQDGFSGATGTVSGGSVSLSGTGRVILLELKR